MNQLIQTTDNNGTGISITDDTQLVNLRKIAEKPIRSLNLDEHPNLLVFPQDFETWGDKIGDEHIFTLEGSQLKTRNIMGFIGYRGTMVSIHSRFEQQGKDYFLHYMLQRVFAINLFDLKYSSDEESIFDYLVYLFPAFLQNALRQGLYKEYQTRHYNDANVRGRIDVNRHIRQNIPFAGRVAYSTREYATDNHVIQLIRHTIEYIESHTFCANILDSNETIREAVSLINIATPSYNRSERQKIIGQNLRPISHPYFNNYRPLQKLCLQILRHKELKYGHDDDKIYGILFDGAWLWEEYLNTILQRANFTHPENKTRKGRITVFADGSGYRYPDFFKNGIVLDAKYKRYGDRQLQNIDRDDLHQLIAYMYLLQAKLGGFIVPLENSILADCRKRLKGYGGMMNIYGIQIHKSESFPSFCRSMAEQEDKLLEQIDNDSVDMVTTHCSIVGKRKLETATKGETSNNQSNETF